MSLSIRYGDSYCLSSLVNIFVLLVAKLSSHYDISGNTVLNAEYDYLQMVKCFVFRLKNNKESLHYSHYASEIVSGYRYEVSICSEYKSV